MELGAFQDQVIGQDGRQRETEGEERKERWSFEVYKAMPQVLLHPFDSQNVVKSLWIRTSTPLFEVIQVRPENANLTESGWLPM